MAEFSMEAARAVGARIAELREEAGMTQEELAEKLGVVRSLIALGENGVRTPDVMSWKRMAEEFHVSTDYICGTSSLRTFKGASISDKLDLERLNELGRHMLYDYYHMLLENPVFSIKPGPKGRKR